MFKNSIKHLDKINGFIRKSINMIKKPSGITADHGVNFMTQTELLSKKEKSRVYIKTINH